MATPTEKIQNRKGGLLGGVNNPSGQHLKNYHDSRLVFIAETIFLGNLHLFAIRSLVASDPRAPPENPPLVSSSPPSPTPLEQYLFHPPLTSSGYWLSYSQPCLSMYLIKIDSYSLQKHFELDTFKDEVKVFEKPSGQLVSRCLSLFGFKDDQCQVGKNWCHNHKLHIGAFLCSFFLSSMKSLFASVCVKVIRQKDENGEESPFTAPTQPISPGTGDPHGWRRTPRTNLLVSPSFAIHGNYLWHFRGALTYSV